MNLIELADSTKKLASWRVGGYGQNSNWRLTNVLPFVGTKTLLFQGDCRGETESPNTHVVNIQFSGLEYSDTPTEKDDFKKIDYKGEDYYVRKPDLHTNCTIRCSCSDFTYRWSYADWLKRVLFGSKPKKYIRRVGAKPRPPVNSP